MADWVSLPLPKLADALREGALELPGYLEELERWMADRDPEVKAFLPEPGRFERLRRQAEALATQYRNVSTRPSLYGVAVGIKDIFRVDGLPTRAGSRLPPELLAGEEAETVRRLRQAGALILGKTVTTEFAYFAPGPTTNPHNPEHTPGGSSSGSAAAVASGQAPLALGTQTIGSILRPASFCGVVGFKPSYGRASTAGVIPLAPSLDHVGWFTRDVPSSAAAAAVLCPDWSSAVPPRRPVIGVPQGPYLDCAESTARHAVEAVVDRLQREGYSVRSVDAMEDFDEVVRHHRTILAAEAARVHADWFREHGALYHPRTAELIRSGLALGPEALDDALQARLLLRQTLLDLMQTHSIDLWACPAAVGPAPRGLDSTGDPVMNLPWTQAGFPALSLPCSVDTAGLPLGLQLAASPGGDEDLMAWAAEIERLISYQEVPSASEPRSGHGSRR
jgi:Asp-tRNA(Asn)/Glu-tRNA(Gln) amidotransferase A subunit family amidase